MELFVISNGLMVWFGFRFDLEFLNRGEG